jgi:hypothetical protein
VWNLAKSRRAFLAEQRQQGDRSFWFYAFTAMGLTEVLEDDRHQDTLWWKPHRSNCAEIEGVLEDLIHDAPNHWKALLSNVFVGRTLTGDPNAEAWNRGRVGVVEISLQFTNILTDYINAFDQFFFALRRILTDIDLSAPDAQERVDKLDAAAHVGVWTSLDAAQSQMADVTRLVGSVAVDLGLHPNRTPEAHAVTVSACERFVIGHEIAHHLLGHTAGADRPDAKATRRYLARILHDAGASDLLANLGESARQEVHADCLGLLISARAVERDPDGRALYGPIAGSFLTLLAVTHARDDWLLDGSSTHPPVWMRLSVLDKLIRHIAAGVPLEEVEGRHAHSIGFLIQMEVFAGGAIRHWLHRVLPEEFSEAGLLEMASKAIDEEAEFADRIPELRHD